MSEHMKVLYMRVITVICSDVSSKFFLLYFDLSKCFRLQGHSTFDR